MLLNGPDVVKSNSEPFDVAVVGAGVVGIFCAAQLEKLNLRVALIEGGNVTPNTLSNAKHTQIIGRHHSSVETGRAMGLGGSGLLWGGQLSELSSSDLLSEKGFWPISYEDLRALYNRVYDLLGLPARLENMATRVLFGGDEGIVGDVERFFSYWLPNPNLAAMFRKMIIHSRRISVFTRCKAVGLTFDETGRTRWVKLRTSQGHAMIAARCVVIAAGVVESVRFMLATRRDPNCPWRDNAQIGLAFQDHIGGELGALIVKNEWRFRDRFESGFVRGAKYMPKLRFSRATSDSGVPLSVCAFPRFHSSMNEHIANVKILVRAFRSGVSYSAWRDLPTSMKNVGYAFFPLVHRYVRERRVLAMMDKGVDLAFQCEHTRRPESKVALAGCVEEADGLPPVMIDWRIGAAEPEFLLEAASSFRKYFDRTGTAELIIDPSLLSDAPSFLSHMRDTSHPSGGLCMSEFPTAGATDPNGLVWGSKNVYVAGAAALAVSGEANITLTALAFTLRLTDHLALALREAD